MKNSFVKSIAFVLFALLSCTSIFAQSFTESTFDPTAATRLMLNTDATGIKAHFAKQGFQEGGIVADGTKRFSGTDKLGAFSIEIATVSLKKGTTTIKLTTVSLKRGATVEQIVVAQDAINTYHFENQKVSSKARSSSSKVDDCLAEYLLSTASNCTSCVSCVTSCVSGNSDWVAKVICSVKCIGSCVSCISNIVGFVKCVVKAL